MKKFYLVLPLLMLLGFSGIYWSHSTQSEAAAVEKAAAVAKIKAEEEAQKLAAEKKAKEDAEQRTATRLAEEAKKEAERLAKWEAESKKIADETAGYTAEVAKLTTEVAKLEASLSALKASKEAKTRELLAASSAVELDAIAKRVAEMEIQRMTEMVVRKAANTSLAKHP